MGNQGSAVWKVNGEEKYFKKINDTQWAEYDNGRHVFNFEFLGNSGDAVYLKKVGWLMYLKLDSSSIIYGESRPIDLDKYLYDGTWVEVNNSQVSQNRSPSRKNKNSI